MNVYEGKESAMNTSALKNSALKKSTLKKFAAITSSLVVFSLISAACNAEHPRREFNKTIKRDHHAGSYTRAIEQHRIENGIQRSSRVETPNGRTAVREITRTKDHEAQTSTRTVIGTRLNGSAYSGETIRQRTVDGFVQNSTRTNADGDTATRSKEVSIDRDSGVISKQVEYTNFSGESGSKTIVIERPKAAIEQ